MRRLVVLIVMVRAFAGCARPSAAVYQEAWDGQASEWEVPPARLVTAPEAGGGTLGPGSGGLVGGVGGSAGDLPVCTKEDQANCCHDDKTSGAPKCTWQRLVPSAAVGITALFQSDKKVAAPVPLQLTVSAPNQFSSLDECMNTPFGFILSGAGMEDDEISSSISHYAIGNDGKWTYLGGGATSGLVAGRDTQLTGDGGMTTPSYTLGSGLCKDLMFANETAIVEVVDQLIDFQIAGARYDAKFAISPNGNATGYYLVIQKGF